MRKLLSLAVLGLAFTGTAFADAVDDIETAIVAKWEKTNSLSFDSETTSKMSNAYIEMNTKTTSKNEMLRKDGKMNSRVEMKTEGTQKMQGKETPIATSTTSINDGTFMYSVSENAGQKTATKMKAVDMTGKALFVFLREKNDLKALPDETVGGEACYVLEATGKGVQPGMPKMTMKFWFSKSQGVAIQTSSKSEDGKITSDTAIKNVKINPSIPADHFVFTAPAGVEVVDNTDMEAKMKKAQEDAAKAQADAAKAQADADKKSSEPAKAEDKPADAKKDEPKKDEKKKDEKKKFKVPGL